MNTRKGIDGLAMLNSNYRYRQAIVNQPVQRYKEYQTIKREEAIDKMGKILDCLKNAERRIFAMNDTKKRWDEIGFNSKEIANNIATTQGAKIKLKRYFNKISRSIELFG